MRVALRALCLLILLAGLSACVKHADDADVRAAIGNAPVVLLSTASCPYCAKLRTDLTAWGAAFDELDVERSSAGQRAYELLAGRAVPILLIGGETLHGYSRERSRAVLAGAGLLPVAAPD